MESTADAATAVPLKKKKALALKKRESFVRTLFFSCSLLSIVLSTFTEVTHDYPPADKAKFPTMRGFWDMIGATFVDCDDDITFIITGVCEYNKVPGRLFYSYYDVTSEESKNDPEYSECKEILAEIWCKLDK